MSCPTDSCRKGAKCLACMERDGRTLPPKLYANEAQILWSAGGTVAYDFTVPADPHNIHRDRAFEDPCVDPNDALLSPGDEREHYEFVRAVMEENGTPLSDWQPKP